MIWNYFGIRQNVTAPAEIAADIQPPLTASQVQESIRLLLELGLIKKLANGYSVMENHLSTEPEFKGMEALPFGEMSLTLAREALHAVAPEHRKFRTLIFSASRNTVGLIQEKLAAFQEEIEELIDKDHHPDGVYTLSCQVFPNTRPRNLVGHARAGAKPP